MKDEEKQDVKDLHSLLRRQLRRHFGDSDAIPPAFRDFLLDVNDAYWGSEDDRTMLERAMDLSSQELMQANSEMRAILESFPDVLLRLDAEGRILDWKAGALTGAFLTSQQVLGKQIQNIPVLEVGRKFQTAITRLHETRSPASFEYSLPQPAGDESYEARLVPLPGDEIIVIVRNITERTLAQQSLARARDQLETRVDERTLELSMANAYLRESEERLRTILDNVQAGIIVVDPETRAIVDANPVALTMTGRAREEVIGHVCHQHLCPSERDRCPVLDLGNRVDNSERILLRADGTSLSILKTVVPIFLGGRKVLLESFVDISERKRIHRELERAKEEAEAASRAKSEFLANMSHELRTPLHQIIGFTELTIKGAPDTLSEKLRRYLTLSMQSSQHLLSLINDILDIAKVEAGKVSLQLSEVNLASLLEDSLFMVREKALKNNLETSLKISNIPDKIVADDRILRQILYNLVSNAAKFTGEGGSIQLRANRIAWVDGHLSASDGKRLEPPQKAGRGRGVGIGFVEVSVADTGIGIREEDLERIFNPFEQVDSSCTRRFEGSGLGLALTREFVELHGGRIWAESQGVGKGSTFHFVIPVSRSPGVDKGPFE